MTIVTIRKKLSDYLKVADDKKIKAIYALLEDDIELSELDYSNELKTALDQPFDNYQQGGKMINAASSKKQVDKILNT